MSARETEVETKPKRIQVAKKVRFEVFKRDKFTCQYCGEKAPDVVLHADHIDPVANGGSNNIINLVTACEGCNLGKGAVLLSDTAAMEKQRQELESLSDRREQIEMLMNWRDELSQLDDYKVDTIFQVLEQVAPEYSPNDYGRAQIKRWFKTYKFEELVTAIEGSFESYFKPHESDVEVRRASWSKSFDYVTRVASVNRRGGNSPSQKRVYYIRGILKNRLNYFGDKQYFAMMKEAIAKDVSLDAVQDFSTKCKNWTEFRAVLEDFNNSNDYPKGAE